MPELDLDVALAIDQYVKDLAAEGTPEQAFHAIADFFDANPGVYEGIHAAKTAAGLPSRNPGPDGAAMTEKYLRNTQAAQADYVRGVQNPRRDPKQAALAANGKWKQRTQAAIQQDRFAKGIATYDVAAAVAAATSDGGSAYAAGIQKRAGKVQAAFSRLAPLIASVSQAVQQMPQDSDQQREARMVENLRRMRDLGIRFRGG